MGVPSCQPRPLGTRRRGPGRGSLCSPRAAWRGDLTDDLQALLGVLGVDGVQLFLQLHDLLGLDGDVRGLALRDGNPGRWGVDSSPRLLALRPSRPLTRAPPEGWWIMMRELGSEWRMPGLPAASSREPMLAAWPTHQVQMGFRMYCMVS